MLKQLNNEYRGCIFPFFGYRESVIYCILTDYKTIDTVRILNAMFANENMLLRSYEHMFYSLQNVGNKQVSVGRNTRPTGITAIIAKLFLFCTPGFDKVLPTNPIACIEKLESNSLSNFYPFAKRFNWHVLETRFTEITKPSFC